MKNKIIIGVGVVFGVLLLIILRPKEGITEDSSSEKITNINQKSKKEEAIPSSDYGPLSTLPADYSDLAPEDRYAPKFTQAGKQFLNDPTNPNDLPPESETLKDLTLPEQEAMDLINSLFASAGKFANDGDVPGLTNVEMTNLLLGENKKSIAYLPDDHPRINEFGQLTDSWGTAYEFHTVSSLRVEVTSAGPDRELFTDDDIELDLE